MKLPKFKTESTMDGTTVLQKLGITDIFDAGCDLTEVRLVLFFRLQYLTVISDDVDASCPSL